MHIALGVVKVMAGFRVDAAHRTDHFRREQDVLDRDHLGQQVDAGLVVHTGVKENIVQQVLRQQGLFQLLRQPPEAAPVVRHSTTAMRDQELQGGEVLEQVAGQALHEGRGVGVQVVRASGVKAAVAAGRHVNHGGDVVLDHLFINGVPGLVAQRRRCPVAARWIGVQVDADVAVLLDTLDQLGDAGRRIDTGRLGQHGRRHEMVGKQLRHAKAQLVANGGPGGRDVEVTNVVGHEAGAGAEDGQVRAALFHLGQLVGLNGLAQFVVADFQLGHFGHGRGVFDARNLAIAPVFQRLGGGGVVTVYINDQGLFLAHARFLDEEESEHDCAVMPCPHKDAVASTR